ncbi:MAG: M48 family metalloprotease [Alphaproteobacteria bacterium]|nr:M48 family metalloprotease [Alphaproteobacteria bacterium]
MGHHNLEALEVSDEIKAVIAHEIGHFKSQDTKLHRILPMRMSPQIGILAGFAGVVLYDLIDRHMKEKSKENLTPEQMKSEQAAEMDRLTKPEEDDSPVMESIGTVAKYVAGGLLGGAIGVGAFALMHRRVEFRADRISAELMGDGKPLARALKMYASGMQQRVTPEVREAAQAQDWFTKLLSQFTHPKLHKRIEKLESWSR